MKIFFTTLITTLISLLYAFNLKYTQFSTDFNQTIKSNNKTISYKGKLYIKNDLILWKYLYPTSKTIWITNNKIYIYEPDLYQVTIYNNQKKDSLFELIKSANKIKPNLYVKKYNDKTIYFQTKNGLIDKIYYKDKIGNLVTLNFYNTKKENISKLFFIPKYPKDVDFIYAN